MASLNQIFDAFGGPAGLARAIGVTTEHAASMRRRRSIPARYWRALLESASRIEPPPISNQDLIDAHARPKSPDLPARSEARL